MKDFRKFVLLAAMTSLLACGNPIKDDTKISEVYKDINPAPFDESCWPGPDYGCPELEANIPDEDFPTDIPEYCVGMYLDCLPSDTDFEPADMYYYYPGDNIIHADTEINSTYYKPGPEGDGKTKCDSSSVKKTSSGESGNNTKATCSVSNFNIEKDFRINDNFGVSGKIYKRDRDDYGMSVSFSWYWP